MVSVTIAPPSLSRREVALPDPNGFAGPVRIRRGRGTWEGVPFTSRGAADTRGLGIHDMVEAIAEPDATRKLDLAAKWIRQQMERSSDVIRAFREGSRLDPEVAADHRRILDNRGRSMARFIDSLADALDPGVSKREATDLLWAFSNEELYRELVEERGWSPDRFERWLAATLRQQLLGSGAT